MNTFALGECICITRLILEYSLEFKWMHSDIVLSKLWSKYGCTRLVVYGYGIVHIWYGMADACYVGIVWYGIVVAVWYGMV